jgi:hypothetical protein
MQRRAIMAVTSEVTKVSNAIAKIVTKKPGSFNLQPLQSQG